MPIHSQIPPQGARAEDGSPPTDAFLLDVARLEGQAALHAVVSEVSHELAHTLSFLRCLAVGLVPGLGPEETEHALKETERISGLLGRMRRLKLPPPDVEPVPVRDIAQRAAAALSGILAERHVSFSILVAEGTALPAEPHLLFILVRDMLKHAVLQAATASTVEIKTTPPDGEQDGAVEVWCSRVQAAPSDGDPFALWGAAPDGSSDLGLSVARRIARNFGWELLLASDAGRTGLRVLIPAELNPAEPAR